jgi:hypothetical protein
VSERGRVNALLLADWSDSSGAVFGAFSAERALIVWVAWLESELVRRFSSDSVGYSFDSSIDMSGGVPFGNRTFSYIPLEKRNVKTKFRVLKPHCPYSAKVCSDLTIDCHFCSYYLEAFSYAFLYSSGRLKNR